ncbi:MAG TPA: hypothetical protein VGV86_13715 [Acidimicrobiales bacterium]|nr:hypothetical protein [Acidimicrobiales bacterium]
MLVDLVGVASPAHPHCQGLTGVLVDDVQQLQPPVIGGLVELEVQGPDVAGAFGAEELSAGVGPAALALAGSGPAQALRARQALRSLAVDGPPLASKDGVGGLPAPSRMLPGDVTQAPTELVLLVGHRTTGQALGRPPLASDLAGSAFGDPEAFHQGHDGPTAALRG